MRNPSLRALRYVSLLKRFNRAVVARNLCTKKPKFDLEQHRARIELMEKNRNIAPLLSEANDFREAIAISDFTEFMLNEKNLLEMKNPEGVIAQISTMFPRLSEEELRKIQKQVLDWKNMILVSTRDQRAQAPIHSFRHDSEIPEPKENYYGFDERRNLNITIKSMRDHMSFFRNYANLFLNDFEKYEKFKECLKATGFDPEIFQRLAMDFKSQPESVRFPRDKFVVLSDKIMHPPLEIFEADLSDQDLVLGEVITGNPLLNQKAAIADLKKTGFSSEAMPFHIEGGNVAFDKKNGIVHICISDHYFYQDGEFSGASVVDRNGEIKKIYDYESYCGFIKNWAKRQGFEACIINRNIKKHSLSKLYHLDTFFNVANGFVFVYKDAMLEEDYKKIQEIYGEKIINISEQDWVNLATNFVSPDEKTLIFTGPVSYELLETIREKGFNYAVSPIHLGTHKNDGIRCATMSISAQRVKDNDNKKAMI